MNRITVFVAHFSIAAVAVLQAASVHATEAAYRGAVAAGDPTACYEARELARAMRHASVPSTRRWGRELFELVSQKCD